MSAGSPWTTPRRTMSNELAERVDTLERALKETLAVLEDAATSAEGVSHQSVRTHVTKIEGELDEAGN